MTYSRLKKTAGILFLWPVFFTLITGNPASAQASFGLQFMSHEAVPEKRTSLNLSNGQPFCFTEKIELSFDLSFAPGYTTYFGYIFRLINEKGMNIDLVYDHGKKTFSLVAGEIFTSIRFQLKDSLMEGAWVPLKCSISKDGTLALKTPSEEQHFKAAAPVNTCFRIFFGTTNEPSFITTDLPPMKIRNLGLATDGQKKYFWPLNESSGETATDNISHRKASVSNPAWISPAHTNWRNISSFNIKGRPGVAFDDKKELIYVAGIDTLYTVSIPGETIGTIPLSAPHNVMLPGNQSIVDPFNGNLYNFYPDELLVSMYDSATHRWTKDFKPAASTERWHLNKFITAGNELILMGGYGQLKYKNVIQRYDLSSGKWDTLKPSGDFYAPRYLSAVGSNKAGDTAYILGGYGSNEGDQQLNPRFYYDLLLYDVKNNRIKKVYDLATPEEPFVFANSMIVDNSAGSYYALLFPNKKFSSQLQLIRGSLTKPNYEKLGTPLPFSFLDVRCFTDLFYCPKSKKMIAVIIYGNQNNYSDIKVYSIDFPVNTVTAAIPVDFSAKNNNRVLIYLIIAVVFSATALAWYRRKRKAVASGTKNDARSIPAGYKTGRIPVAANSMAAEKISAQPVIEEPVLVVSAEMQRKKEFSLPAARISLFGNFEVVTDEGTDITKSFTPLLKEMFLLILINSLQYRKGVTSEKMSDILWTNKDVKDAKNNRSVNLVKLNNLLQKTGNSIISRKKTAAWMFEFDPATIRIDFLDYLELIERSASEDFQDTAARLSSIVKNGAFLPQTHYEWLNDIKAGISNFVTETLLKYAATLRLPGDAEKQITIANEIFQFDELNEHALTIKCKSLISLGRHTLAKNVFDQFLAKYKHIYGPEFEISYSKIISS